MRSHLVWRQKAYNHRSPNILVCILCAWIFPLQDRHSHLNWDVLGFGHLACDTLPNAKRRTRCTGCWVGLMHCKAGEQKGLQCTPTCGGRKVSIRASPEAAVFAAVAAATGAAALLATRSKPRVGGPGRSQSTVTEDGLNDAKVVNPEEDPDLPADVLEALEDFDGDFSGPWHALGLEPEEGLTAEEIRVAYRQAVRVEHPDTSDRPDAEKRLQQVRNAYAILSDDSTKELLLEALFKQAGSFAELKALEEEDNSSRDNRPLKLIVGLGVILLLVAGAARLTSPDMKLRSVKEMQGARPRFEIQDQS